MKLIGVGIISGESIVYIRGMIRSRVQDIARAAGIENAYQLQALTGLAVDQAYRLWTDRWTQINFKTLNTLCNHLNCKPSDLLDYTADPDDLGE